jgi:hypothetical protein
VDATQLTRAWKQAVLWTHTKEAEFLTYLSEEFSSMVMEASKKFVGAINHLKEKFPVQLGICDNNIACTNIW